MNRRKFLKYAGATGAVVGASALGLNYLSKPQPALPSQEATTASTATAPSSAILPMITRLTYEASRALNSKIYDIQVDVEIFDPARRLSSVLVALEPVAYAHLPTDAFPQEETRTAALQSAGLEKEILSTVFSDLKGGREYDLRAGAADSSGVVDERTSRTEYVREFENIAAQDDLAVIADYYTWYGAPPDGWGDGVSDSQGRRLHVYTPLLGEYDSADPLVIAKHIDWATGYGIDVFAVSWWGSESSIPQTTIFEQAFLNHPMLNQMKFFILYENNGRLRIQNPNDSSDKWIEDLDEPFNSDRLVSDFAYLTKYFSHPSYLKVDGKPLVIFDYTESFRGDIDGVFRSMRQRVRENGGWELYLVNDLAMRAYHPGEIVNKSHPHILKIIESTDAIGYGMPDCYLCHDIEEPYKLWHNAAIEHAKDYVPYSMPGFEPSPNIPQYQNAGLVRRDPRTFGKLVNLSIKHATRRMIGIKSYNEWYAGIEIEPSSDDHGFDYLNVVKTSTESLRHA